MKNAAKKITPEALFKASTVAAQITDADYNVAFDSDLGLDLPVEVKKQAEGGVVAISPDLRLRNVTIRGGHMLWMEDFSTVNDMICKLRSVQDELEDRHEVLSAELLLRERKARLDERNRLYDNIFEALKDKLSLMDDILKDPFLDEEDKRRRLSRICVVGAFIKRRSNLSVLSEHDSRMDARELELSILEYLSYLEIYGVDCSFARRVEGSIPSTLATKLFEDFDACVSEKLDVLKTLSITLVCEESEFSFKLTLNGNTILL